ncbi:MAG: hypothetical protein GF355_05600 [Candidatus Eisenbacteria bacterium]|nr:hypothetical protein [Candidatus Eisenbacteria bacterium]
MILRNLKRRSTRGQGRPKQLPPEAAIIAGWVMTALLAVCGPAAGAESLDLGVSGYGISLGNSRSFNGLRINAVDDHVQRVNGINLTLWRAKDNDGAEMNGLLVGLVGPDGGDVNGVAAGLVGVGAAERLRGAAIGGVGVGAPHVTGIAVGGIGLGATERLLGIGIGGIGVGAGERLQGLAFGGLAVGAGSDLQGVAFGGLAVGAGRRLQGIAIGGAAVGAGQHLEGLGVTPGMIGATRITGAALSGLYLRSKRVTGLATGAYCRVTGRMAGLSIGLLNDAGILNGLQLGVVNIARNNPKGLQVLPLLNFHVE